MHRKRALGENLRGEAYSGSRAFRVLTHQADRGWESLGGNIGGHPGGGGGGGPNRGAYNYFQASLIGAQTTPSPVFRALSNGIGG
jgi:hypothetical protein